MNSHKQPSVINKDRNSILNNSKKKYDTNGIFEGLKTTRYTIKKMIKNPLYTHILIEHPRE
jgi:hypothetical protein